MSRFSSKVWRFQKNRSVNFSNRDYVRALTHGFPILYLNRVIKDQSVKAKIPSFLIDMSAIGFYFKWLGSRNIGEILQPQH